MKNNNIQSSRLLFALALCFATFARLSAQDAASTNKWHYLAEPYFMFPYMSGTTGVGTLLDVEVEADPGDIFDKLQFGAMLYLEAGNDKWAICSDVLYMNLGQDVKTGTVVNSGEVDAKQLGWEVSGLYKSMPWLDVGLGGRLNVLEMGVDVVTNEIGGGTTARSKKASKSWFDPILIARVKNPPGKKFLYQFRGDMGGFGVGSDFAWQIQAYAGYQFSKLFQVTAGYRYIGIDYQKAEGDDRFLYDMDTFGPVIRFGFNF